MVDVTTDTIQESSQARGKTIGYDEYCLEPCV